MITHFHKSQVSTELWRLLDMLSKNRDLLVRTCLHEKFITVNKPEALAFEPTRPGVRSVLMSLDEGTNFESSVCAEDFLIALWHFLHRTWHVSLKT